MLVNLLHDDKTRAHNARIGFGTYGLDNTSLQVLAGKAGQQKVGSVASSHGSSAGQDSDGLETHIENLVENRWLI